MQYYEHYLAPVNLLEDVNFKSFIDDVKEQAEETADLPLPEQRKILAKQMAEYNKECEEIFQMQNLTILGLDNNQIPLRIYIPNESTNLPVIVYFHGGGWVFGSIEEADAVCRRLANHLGCIVASVEYRLAPEFPFPKPLEDCYEATKWIAGNAQHFGGDQTKIIVSGESAGGNLAAAVAFMAKDKHGPKLSAQLLLYPVISSVIQDAVYDQCPDHYFLTKEDMHFFWDMYVPIKEEKKNPYASLENYADFSHLPPALIITAEYDPLTFDIDKYANQLKKANVQVIRKSFPGLIHGFLYIPLYKEKQKVAWTKEIGGFLHKLGV